MASQGYRAYVSSSGEVYLARDKILHGGRLQPQHLVIRDGEVVWVNHPGGGMMTPLAKTHQKMGPIV